MESSWRPPIGKWYNVSAEAYVIIYAQAKERFEATLEESQSITDKSLKMLAALGAFLGFIIAFFVKKELVVGYYYIYSVVYLAEAVLLFFLIAPKNIKNKGLAPEVSIPKNLDAPDDQGFQVQLVYFQSICLLQDNIEFMNGKNKGRIRLYQYAIILFLFLLISTGVFIMVSL